MPRRSIDIDSFPHASPIPAASRIGPLIVSSVVVSRDPGTRDVPDDIDAQIANLFRHVDELLSAAEAGWDDVIKMNFWVPTIEDRPHLDGPWIEHFPDPASRPARHTQVGSDVARCDFTAYVIA